MAKVISIPLGAALKGKNSLPLGANFFLRHWAMYIMDHIDGMYIIKPVLQSYWIMQHMSHPPCYPESNVPGGLDYEKKREKHIKTISTCAVFTRHNDSLMCYM